MTKYGRKRNLNCQYKDKSLFQRLVTVCKTITMPLTKSSNAQLSVIGLLSSPVKLSQLVTQVLFAHSSAATKFVSSVPYKCTHITSRVAYSNLHYRASLLQFQAVGSDRTARECNAGSGALRGSSKQPLWRSKSEVLLAPKQTLRDNHLIACPWWDTVC